MFDVPPELPPGPPPAPPILPSQRLMALLEVVLCSGFPTQILLFNVMFGFGMKLTTADGHWSPVFVSVLSLLDTALVVGLAMGFLAAHGERTRDVLIGHRPLLREALIGVALMPVILAVATLMLLLLYLVVPQLHDVAQNPLAEMLQSRRAFVAFGIVAMIAGGVREEVQRGFILHRFEQYLGGGGVGVIVHSVLFGLGHVDQGSDAVVAITTLGAIWGTIYLKRRSIIAPMVSHAGFNLMQLVKFAVMR